MKNHNKDEGAGGVMGQANYLRSLPAGWLWTKLSEITEVIRGASPRPKGDPRFFGGDIPWIMISDVTRVKGKLISRTRDTVTKEGADRSRFLPKGTLILSNSGTVCVPKILAVDGCIHDGFVAFPGLTDQVEMLYLFYYFDHIRSRMIQENRQGVTQVNLNTTIVKSIDIPLSPLTEQRRIVAKIEELLTKLDAGVEELRKAKTQLKRYRQSVLKAAVTGELTKEWREAHRGDLEPASELLARILKERREKWEVDQLAKMKVSGKIPKNDDWKEKYVEPTAPDTGNLSAPPPGWTWSSLGQTFAVYVGATPSRAKSSYWKGDVHWVSSSEVAFCRIKGTRETITELGLKNTSTDLHPTGTVLLGMIGEGKTRGQAAILDVSACNSQNSAAIRVSEAGLPPEFIYYFLEGEYERTRTLGSGNNQPALNKSRVQAMLFPLPPIKEQHQIVEEVERLFSITDAIEKTIQQGLKQAERMRQSILNQAFEGKLVPQDPNDEPAELLLERIKTERAKRAAEKSAAPKRRTTSC